jgi:hypothetical protein
MENEYNDTIEENQFAEEEDINIEELTSHKIEKNAVARKNKKKLIVILEHAYFEIFKFSTLELLKSKKETSLINSDEHYKVIRQMKKTLEDYRPDVTHQVK